MSTTASRRPRPRTSTLLGGLLACLLQAPGLVAPAPDARGDERRDEVAHDPIRIEGSWYVLVHYRDDSTAHPELTHWLDLVWTFTRKGSRLEWAEFPIVVFQDQSGRFEEIAGNPRHRVTAAWEPNRQQRRTIDGGPRVNRRGSRTKSLRGSDGEGWTSASRMRGASAAALGYREKLTLRDLDAMPLFLREDIFGRADRTKVDGSVRYQVEELRDGGDTMLGSYERDGIRHGSFRMWRTPPMRGLLPKERRQMTPPR